MKNVTTLKDIDFFKLYKDLCKFDSVDPLLVLSVKRPALSLVTSLAAQWGQRTVSFAWHEQAVSYKLAFNPWHYSKFILHAACPVKPSTALCHPRGISSHVCECMQCLDLHITTTVSVCSNSYRLISLSIIVSIHKSMFSSYMPTFSNYFNINPSSKIGIFSLPWRLTSTPFLAKMLNIVQGKPFGPLFH